VLADVGAGLDDAVSATLAVPGQDWTVSVPAGTTTAIERILPWLILVVGLGLAMAVALFLRNAARRRDAAIELADTRLAELERRSREDVLTHVFNRRHFSEVLTGEFARTDRGGDPPAVLMLDIDHFKQINDEHGHLTGDEVLEEVARRIGTVMRRYDVLARWGGDEFAVLALGPSIDHEGVAALGERARRAVNETPIDAKAVSISVTLSVGAALSGDGLESPDALVDAADEALYDAKANGRDCIRLWEPSGSGGAVATPA
jgi:diguanylate cyclase (GGDEF)-like protein